MYGIAGWSSWVLSGLGAVGWMFVGAPEKAIMMALSGSALGVLFFGIGVIIQHLEAIRLCAERLTDESVNERVLEERSQELKRRWDEARRRF